MINGLKLSILIACIGMFVGSFLGIICAVCQRGDNKLLKKIINIYIEIFRNTPALIQMYLLYFGLAQFNIHISGFFTAIIALGLNTGAYTSVIFLTGLKAVNVGQGEAARALGMSHLQAYIKIIIPQAFRIVIPPLTNQFIGVFLFSSIAATVAVPELLGNALIADSKSMRTFEIFIIATILYLIVTTIISLISSFLERRYKY